MGVQIMRARIWPRMSLRTGFGADKAQEFGMFALPGFCLFWGQSSERLGMFGFQIS